MSEETTCETGEKIPHFVNNPETNAATAPELKLYRPKIHYAKAVLYVLTHFAAGTLIAFVWVWLQQGSLPDSIESILSRAWLIIPLLFLLTMRFTFIWFVRLYQRYAKSETRLRCCMTPSCSEYAILAFRKYGAILGGVKTWKRLLRCHPPGGIDYP